MEIQTRRRRKKKNRGGGLLLLSGILFVLLIFCLGVYAGVFVSVKTEQSPVVEKVEEEKNDNRIELEKLEALKLEMVRTITEKYPFIKVSLAIKNLDTGAYIEYNRQKMNSASLIKLFILETVYGEMSKGNYTLSEENKENLEKLITESDNKAANIFIDNFGGIDENRKVKEENIINTTIKNHGYKDTELNRKMYNEAPPGGATGFENYTSVADVVCFLEGIYNKTLLQEPYNTKTLDYLKNQTWRVKIPALVDEKYSDVIIANKTGELSTVENDAAIIIGKDFNVVFVIMTDGIPEKSDGSTDMEMKKNVQKTISELGLKVVDFYKANKFQ